jgi:hypothetical protein
MIYVAIAPLPPILLLTAAKVGVKLQFSILSGKNLGKGYMQPVVRIHKGCRQDAGRMRAIALKRKCSWSTVGVQLEYSRSAVKGG